MKKRINPLKMKGLLAIIFAFGTLSFTPGRINHEPEWKLIKTSKKDLGWKLYKAKSPNSKLDLVKITGTMKCTPQEGQAAVMEMIVDPELRITKKGKSLGWVRVLSQTDTEMEVYDYMTGNGLAKNRDVVVRYTKFGEPNSDFMGVKWHQIDKPGYEATDTIIRMPVAQGSWEFKAIDSEYCTASCNYQFDPGGTPPAWLINMVVKKSAPIEYEHLRGRVTR